MPFSVIPVTWTDSKIYRTKNLRKIIMKQITEEMIKTISDVCLAFNLGKAYRLLLQPYEEFFKAGNVTLMQYGMLVHINKQEPISGRELSRNSGHDPSTISRNLKKLIQQNLVEVPDKGGKDKRKKMYHLSSEGKQVLRESSELWYQATEELQKRIPVPLWNTMVALLKDIQEILENS